MTLTFRCDAEKLYFDLLEKDRSNNWEKQELGEGEVFYGAPVCGFNQYGNPRTAYFSGGEPTIPDWLYERVEIGYYRYISDFEGTPDHWYRVFLTPGFEDEETYDINIEIDGMDVTFAPPWIRRHLESHFGRFLA